MMEYSKDLITAALNLTLKHHLYMINQRSKLFFKCLAFVELLNV